MKVIVDYNRCEGHGMCEERAGDIFRLDDAGDLHFAYEGEEVPAGREADAKAAAGVCPVAALKIVS
ncbi:ferredoxin [Streptosporangium algeriense]|uniref:Ferredoxin n=1 Tax=Streptosporangium algeriense TaxID=1682748 RepID=A0ABW3DXS1_9ACTN